MFKPYTGLLRHINKQTTAAAVVDIAEAIDNPAYREGAMTGMLIRAVKLIMDPGNSALGVDNSSYYMVSQLQVGDRSAAPSILDPDSPWLMSHYENQGALATYGRIVLTSPMYHDILKPEPVIVSREFTVYWDGTDAVNFQSKDVFTLVYYQNVEVHKDVYHRLLLDQTRTS